MPHMQAQSRQITRTYPLIACFLVAFCLASGRPARAQDTEATPDLNAITADFAEQAKATSPDQEGSWLERLNLGGYLKNETAYRFDEPRSITKIRNIIGVHGTYGLKQDMTLTFSGWAYHDLAYNLFDYETISARFVRDSNQPLVFVDNLAQEKDSNVIQIRELYLDMSTDNTDIRLGKQFVVWGILEGIRITDEINPLDFRELILPDLLDYRIPLWTAKVDYYAGDNTYQFLWIPDIKFHKPAPAGSEWELLQTVPNTVPPKSYRLKNSEFGVRWSRSFGSNDLSLSYFHTWDDFPVVFRSSELNAGTDPVFFPTFTQINMFGATLARPMGIGILKSEAAFVPDKYFGLKNDVDHNHDGYLDSQGELRRPHLRWGVGYDFSIWGADFSPAISQWIIFHYDDGLLQDQFDTSLTLFIRKPLPEQSAVFQMLMINLVNLQEFFIKPKFIFNMTDHLQISTGLDLFYGLGSQLGVSSSGGGISNLNSIAQRAQFFGNFHNNDRLFAEFKYTF